MSTAAAEPDLILGQDSAGLRMTPKEFDAIEEYDENYHYELVDGVLVVSPIPLPVETGPNELLGHLLLIYQEDHPEGRDLDYTLPQQYIRLPRSRRLADRVIWTGLGRMPKRNRDVPTIVVEFVSRGHRNRQRDYVDKRKDYKRAGIKQYWIIGRFERTITVFTYGATGSRKQVIPEGKTYTSPLLPGFVVPLDRLLIAADRLAEAEDQE
jgi:Uma2 family endonuclease